MTPLRRLATLLLAGSLAVTPATAQPVSRPASESPPSDTPRVVVDERTAEILDGALRFLASKQTPGGAWSAGGNNHQAAITAYVLNAFLANGHLPSEGPHGAVVQRGVDFLLDCVRPDGYIAAPTGEHNMYGHGIACIVLGEVYGTTAASSATHARLRPALERAIRLIVQTQNPQGGWRYQPRVADADISVTVLQVAALRIAKNNGFDVPQRTLDRAVSYVRACFDNRSGGFTYQANGGSPGFARTCAAIYSLQLLGFYDDPMVRRGSEYANAQFENPQLGDLPEWFTYGNFYGAPAHYMIGGDAWDTWYRRIKGRLLPAVVSAGDTFFWRPLDGGNGVNDVFATAVYTTILAMPYQLLPIYQR